MEAWDGSTGGELRLKIRVKLLIEAGGRLDVSSRGYRGGKSKFELNTVSLDGECEGGSSSGGKGGQFVVSNAPNEHNGTTGGGDGR